MYKTYLVKLHGRGREGRGTPDLCAALLMPLSQTSLGWRGKNGRGKNSDSNKNLRRRRGRIRLREIKKLDDNEHIYANRQKANV